MDDLTAGTADSNRLPVLAAEIRQAHADVQEAAKTAAERAIAAGHRLLEARALVKHGEWLPWLREHCALAERTAQLYMQLARKGAEPATVAHLGLQAAAKALLLEYGYHRPMYEGDDDQRRDWCLFALFLRLEVGMPVEHAVHHTDWLGRKDWKSPDEWLGPEGREWASRCGLRASEGLLAGWCAFKDNRSELQLPGIESELERLAQTDPESESHSRREGGSAPGASRARGGVR